jgi:hypothetical protein
MNNGINICIATNKESYHPNGNKSIRHNIFPVNPFMCRKFNKIHGRENKRDNICSC